MVPMRGMPPTGSSSTFTGIVPVIVMVSGVTESMKRFAFERLTSAVHCSSGVALGLGPLGQIEMLPTTGTLTDVMGTGYWISPIEPCLSSFWARGAMLLWRKVTPGRVTRMEAALVTS